MSRDARTHIVNDAAPLGDDVTTSRALSKEEFGRRLYKLMAAKGWRQAELARRAGIGRDSVSTYINGRSTPTQQNLDGLSRALGVPSNVLLPNHTASAIATDKPEFEIRVSPGDPSKAWVKLDRLVSFDTATRIGELLRDEAASRK